MQPTIAYREYINYHGTLRLACEYADDFLSFVLPPLLSQINYLGKRGGFMQMTELPLISTEPPAGHFIHLTSRELQPFLTTGTLQVLDDCGPNLTFAKADIYSDAKVTLNKDRVLRHVVLPYALMRSSRDYSWYQRIPSA